MIADQSAVKTEVCVSAITVALHAAFNLMLKDLALTRIRFGYVRLTVHLFWTLEETRGMLRSWQDDYINETERMD